MELNKILYATISTFEIEERLRRDDATFDAWEYFAEKIGHKNPSTLRKMSLPRTERNAAKLGLEEAIVIMNVSQDYRILHYMITELKKGAISNERQMDLFSQSCRSLGEAIEGRRQS